MVRGLFIDDVTLKDRKQRENYLQALYRGGGRISGGDEFQNIYLVSAEWKILEPSGIVGIQKHQRLTLVHILDCFPLHCLGSNQELGDISVKLEVTSLEEQGRAESQVITVSGKINDKMSY